jgi:hypothetical protein
MVAAIIKQAHDADSRTRKVMFGCRLLFVVAVGRADRVAVPFAAPQPKMRAVSRVFYRLGSTCYQLFFCHSIVVDVYGIV